VTTLQLEKRNGGKEQTKVVENPSIWAPTVAVLLSFIGFWIDP